MHTLRFGVDPASQGWKVLTPFKHIPKHIHGLMLMDFEVLPEEMAVPPEINNFNEYMQSEMKTILSSNLSRQKQLLLYYQLQITKFYLEGTD